MKLESPLDFNEDVQPACLPTPNWSPDLDTNSRCIASGWGNLYFEGNSPNNLQWVEMPVVTNDVCQDAHNYYNFSVVENDWITNSMICAGYVHGGYGTCQGDSGGPLVCLNENSNAILTGITSWAVGCAYPGYYSVFARVTEALNWINAYMVSLMSEMVIGQTFIQFSIDYLVCTYFYRDQLQITMVSITPPQMYVMQIQIG